MTTEPKSEAGRGFDDFETLLGGASALFAAVVVAVVGGLPGMVTAVLVPVAWYALPSTYAFAVGQIGVLAVLDTGNPAALLAAQVGLLGVLLAPAVELSDTEQLVAVTLAWVGVGGLAAWASTRPTVGISLAGGTLVIATALVAYGLHRYQQVSLGLVEDAHE